MPVRVTNSVGQEVRGGKVNITGGCCLGLTFFIICAILGFIYLIGLIVEVIL